MKRELIVTADGRDRTVSVEGPLPDGRFRVTIDGSDHEVDGRAIRPGTWSIVLDGRSYVVDLDKRRTGIAASVGASEAMLQVEDALHRRLARRGQPRGQARGETIRAPIAGKVVKVLVAVGDRSRRARRDRARGDEDGERAGRRARRHGHGRPQAGGSGRRYRRPARRDRIARATSVTFPTTD